MARKAVVLLSGGLDSAYNLARAAGEMEVVLALHFSYGQRAVTRERNAAEKLSSHYQVPFRGLETPWFGEFTRTALLGHSRLPTGAAVQPRDHAASLRSAAAVWVPNRNGIFMNIAAGFAEGLGAELVIPGFNAEEAATFPDNSEGFLKVLDQCFTYSTATGVRGHCYSLDLSKAEIVRDAIRVGLPLHLIWPCYQGGDSWCGECESCQRFARGLADNGLDFHTERSKC